MCLRTTSGINSSFPELSPSLGQVAYVLRTRSPLSHPRIATLLFSLDLHVLTTPPAFTLSQNQTLRKNLLLKIPIDCSTFCVVIYFFYISIRWTFFKVVAKKIFGWFAQSYLVNFKELLFYLPRLSRERPFIKNYLSTSVKRIFCFFWKFFKPLNFSDSPVPQKELRFFVERPPIKNDSVFFVKLFFNFFSKNFFFSFPNDFRHSFVKRPPITPLLLSIVNLFFGKKFHFYRKLLSIRKKYF